MDSKTKIRKLTLLLAISFALLGAIFLNYYKPFMSEQELIYSKTDAVVLVRNVDKSDIGTGFFISDNLIVTNNHVIKDGENLVIYTKTTKEDGYPVEVISSDDYVDIALLKLKDWDKFKKENKINYLSFSKYDTIEPVETVYTIGHPWALTWTISRGIISNDINIIANGPKFTMQSDAHLFQGNSGGTLIDTDGLVVGLNTYMISNTGGSFGFSTPAGIVEKAVNDLLRYKEIRWPILGFLIGDDLTIKEVFPDTPASKAGLMVNDKITYIKSTLANKPISNFTKFLYEVSSLNYNDFITLTVERDGKPITVNVKPIYKISDNFK